MEERLAPVRRVALTYALVSFVWILLSDKAIDFLMSDHDAHLYAHTWKGWFFVLVTTVLLYETLRRLYERLIDSTDQQVAAARREAQTAALLQAVAEASSDLMFAKDQAGRYLLFNGEAARVMGLAQEGVIGRSDAELFSPEQAARFVLNDERVRAERQSVVVEELVNTIEGEKIFQTSRGVLSTADGGLGIFGVARDVTDLVTTRRRMENSERRHRVMFELNPLPMFVVDVSSQRFLAVNAAAVSHYGFSRDEFIGLSLADIRPPEAMSQLTEHWGAAVDPERPARVGPVSHWTKDRRVIDVHVDFCDIEFDGRGARLVMVRDVTQASRLERERDAALNLLNDILSRVTDGFIAVRPDQHLTYVNRQAAAFIAPGAEPTSLVGQLVWDVLPGAVGTRYADAFFSAMGTGQSAVVEDWFEPWQRWIECRIYPSAQGASVYFTDISERKQTEQELARSQQDLSALAARLMSQERVTNRRLAQALHDQLGQQLSSARLYLDVIEATQAGGEPVPPGLVAKALNLVSGAMAEVRDVLLDLRPPLLEEQGLAAALDNELRNSPAGELGMHLALEVCDDIWGRRWPDHVEYAAFMIAREAVANAMLHARARMVTVSVDGGPGFLCLRVEDNGVGISADVCGGVPGHLGIVGMRERAQAVGGRLSVGPAAAGGTVVDLTVEDIA